MQTATTAAPDAVVRDRRELILDAAEASFIRNGFHRTTMQDIARDAGMSAPNLYRYFKAKEDIVLAMADRECKRAEAMIMPLERGGDRRAALMAIVSNFFLTITPSAAVLRLDLWSESTRNPAIGELTATMREMSRRWFVETLSALATSPDCDPVALHEAVSAMLHGVVVNLATVPGYDPAPAITQLHGLIDAGLAGRLPATSRTGADR